MRPLDCHVASLLAMTRLKTGIFVMLAWIAFSGFVCVICGVLGFGALVALTPMMQGMVLLVMAIAGMILLGSFEAHETSRRDEP